jgi:hypothetical protein
MRYEIEGDLNSKNKILGRGNSIDQKVGCP